MKTSSMAILLLTAVNAKDFGIKNGDDWMLCSEDNTNCADDNHMNQNDAVCVRRFLKQVGNTAAPDYINELSRDTFLNRTEINTLVSRCMNNADKDYWLGLNMIKD